MTVQVNDLSAFFACAIAIIIIKVYGRVRDIVKHQWTPTRLHVVLDTL